MTNNKTIGVYYVNTTDREGWTDETLEAALREPLAEIGLDTEIGDSINNPVIFGAESLSGEDNVMSSCVAIVENIVCQ